jgi:hypothetical protein
LVPHSWSRPPGYRGTPSGRLCRSRAAAALALALAAGGCSLSYQLDSLSSRSRAPDVEHTGSIRAAAPLPSHQGMAHEGDFAATRAAVNEALGKSGKDTSIPWENPSTGARGTVTPLSSVYTQNGASCRDFLASYVRNGAESWMQGEACRGQHGGWEVRHMKPWLRT